jgi:hypothetical protein
MAAAAVPWAERILGKVANVCGKSTYTLRVLLRKALHCSSITSLSTRAVQARQSLLRQREISGGIGT